MSFSAHADAKGIMQLIRMAEPRNMLLVHGEAAKMEFLKGKIEQEFSECIPTHRFKRISKTDTSIMLSPLKAGAGSKHLPSHEKLMLTCCFFSPLSFTTAGIDCYMPANGETATVTTNPSVPVDISLNLLKREMALGGMCHRFFERVTKNNSFSVVSVVEAHCTYPVSFPVLQCVP